MANSNFETSMKRAGEAIDETAKETGREATGLYEQAKSAATGAYESASDMAQDAVNRVQNTADDIDEIVTDEVGRHPKAVVALSIGVGFALGVLFASSFRTPERDPRWYDRLRS